MKQAMRKTASWDNLGDDPRQADLEPFLEVKSSARVTFRLPLSDNSRKRCEYIARPTITFALFLGLPLSTKQLTNCISETPEIWRGYPTRRFNWSLHRRPIGL